MHMHIHQCWVSFVYIVGFCGIVHDGMQERSWLHSVELFAGHKAISRAMTISGLKCKSFEILDGVLQNLCDCKGFCYALSLFRFCLERLRFLSIIRQDSIYDLKGLI